MSDILIQADGISDVTIVPNVFIDEIMPSANGAYVKVYIYLLRMLMSNNPRISISSIADKLENTENDVIRALNYWEKLNLLIITRNNRNEIISISLVDPRTVVSDSTVNNSGVITPMSSSVVDTDDFSADVEIAASNMPAQQKFPVRQTYSADKIAALSENEQIKYALHIIEIYLNRPLKPMDLQLIFYLYDELHFSPELIMYLYEYCVSKGKKNTSYIEAVALTWASDGIDTEEKAREAATLYNEHIQAVTKAFGLNRTPGQIEKQYITKWVEVFGFSDDIITEACNRTILRTQKPDFKYADKILDTWFKKNVKSYNDILKLDEEFAKSNKAEEYNYNKVTPINKPANNRFNQFPQRSYSDKDYAELEKKLLNKGLS